jgi:exonuclease III
MTPIAPVIDTALRIATLNVGCGFARKLPDIIARCVSSSLDIIALQKIGDPAVSASSIPHHTLVFAPGSSNYEAGVGLLISHALTPRFRAYERSKDGCMIGVIFDLTEGRRTRLLVISAYMPTGLDHASSSSASVDTAHQLYAEMLSWTVDMHQIIMLGAFNETRTVHNPLPLRQAASLSAVSSVTPSPIDALAQAGFVDEYRRCYPDASASPGYTHYIDSALRPSCSRIDYIWTRGIEAECATRVRLSSKLRYLLHHMLLWTRLHLPQLAACDAPLVRLRLPNLRTATAQHEQRFVDRLERRIGHRQIECYAHAHSDDAYALDELATAFTAFARDACAAFAELPITGDAPFRSDRAMQLHRQRRNHTRLLRMTIIVHHSG